MRLIIEAGSCVGSQPVALVALDSKTESFQIILETEVDLIAGDYIEVFIKNNLTTSSILVNDLQFRVSE